MSRKHRVVGLSGGSLVAVGVAVVGLLLGQDGRAQTKAQGDTATVERSKDADRHARESSRFKTREGRLQAQPLDWNATTGKPAKVEVKPPTEKAAPAKPDTSKGGRPNPRAKREAQKLHPEEWRQMKKSAANGSWGLFRDGRAPDRFQLAAADIFTEYCENCPSVNADAPQAAIGKLFTNAGTCTASVISGNNVIVTAAHCCYNRGTNSWIGGWTFAPAYDNGNAPYGTFDWSSATVLNSWINNGDVASDVCTIRLQNDARGHAVTYYTGWLGRSWDWPSNQEHHALGYPGNLGNGNTLQLCTSESFSPGGSCGGNAVLNTGCSMTYGSSGGPWIRHYRSDNWVNSVVHGYDSQSCTGTFGQTFNGARFTSSNIVPLCTASGC